MKKIILSIIIAVVSLTAVNAQNYKWWAGGKTNLWIEPDRISTIVAPEVGYHLTGKLTLAASIGVYNTINDDIDDSYGLILNPYLRFNAYQKGNLLFFVDSGIEFGMGDIDGFQIGCKPGMAIFLSDRITLAFQLGFVGYNDGNGMGGRSEGVGFDLSGYQSGFALFYSF